MHLIDKLQLHDVNIAFKTTLAYYSNYFKLII